MARTTLHGPEYEDTLGTARTILQQLALTFLGSGLVDCLDRLGFSRVRPWEHGARRTY